MTINLYTGTPGSGKSYHLITRILGALRWNQYVISNFPVRFTPKQVKKGYDDRFFYMQNEQITIESLIDFALDHEMLAKCRENQCLVVIDEAGGRFNCRDFQNSNRAEWIDFFSQHRKLGFTFILVAQNDRMIDRQIRGLIETEFKHRCINRFGPLWVIPIKTFVSVEYWYTVKQRVSSELIFLRKKIANQYDHMKTFSGFKLSQVLLDKIESQQNGVLSAPAPELAVNINAIYGDEKE